MQIANKNRQKFGQLEVGLEEQIESKHRLRSKKIANLLPDRHLKSVLN